MPFSCPQNHHNFLDNKRDLWCTEPTELGSGWTQNGKQESRTEIANMGMCTSREGEDTPASRHGKSMEPTIEDSPLMFGRGAGGDSATASGNLFGARQTLRTSSFVNKDNLKQRPNVKHRKQRKA